jgi:hypothetical protein
MSSKKTSLGFEMVKSFNFMGKSGVKIIKGLRVAFLSGIDFDVIGESTTSQTSDSKESFLGNYFTDDDL